MIAGEHIPGGSIAILDASGALVAPIVPPPPFSLPRWLDEVLAKHAVLDLHHPDARRELAAAIATAAAATAPQQAATIVETIACSARAVLEQKIASTHLKQHVLVDAEYAPRIAREIGRNAAQTVILVLAVGGEE